MGREKQALKASFSVSQEDAQPSSFDIQVRDPIKHGESTISVSLRRSERLRLVRCLQLSIESPCVQAYVSYKVCTKTSMHQYRQRQTEVLRRFKDFAWLREQLQEQNRGELWDQWYTWHLTVGSELCEGSSEAGAQALAVDCFHKCKW